ncbi:uncharacterized protein LOC142493741 [Ascaphus truei]|uniref:uncharacterized protein LOC142493741 n=1 Tax=Ascaphus truei TaxID=8439 RepID=UPI003F5957B6
MAPTQTVLSSKCEHSTTDSSELLKARKKKKKKGGITVEVAEEIKTENLTSESAFDERDMLQLKATHRRIPRIVEEKKDAPSQTLQAAQKAIDCLYERLDKEQEAKTALQSCLSSAIAKCVLQEKEREQLERDRVILSSKLEKAYADNAQYQSFMAQVGAKLEASEEKNCHFNTELRSLREIFEGLNSSFEMVTQECKNLYVQVSEGDKKLHELGEEKKQLAQEKLDVQTALQNAERVLQEERVSLERRTQAENMLQSQLRELRTHLQDTKEKWVNAEEKQRVLQEESFQTAYKISMMQDYLSTQCVPKEQHEELKATLSITRASLEEELKLAAEHTSQQLTALQALIAELKTQLAKKEEREKVSVCQVAGLTQRYEVKMAYACKLLDHTARDKVRLQLELDNARKEYRQLQIRNEEDETYLSFTLSQLGDMESRLNSKEAELTTALSGKRSAEGQLQELKNQIAGLNETLGDTTKRQSQKETMEREFYVPTYTCEKSAPVIDAHIPDVHASAMELNVSIGKFQIPKLKEIYWSQKETTESEYVPSAACEEPDVSVSDAPAMTLDGSLVKFLAMPNILDADANALAIRINAPLTDFPSALDVHIKLAFHQDFPEEPGRLSGVVADPYVPAKLGVLFEGHRESAFHQGHLAKPGGLSGGSTGFSAPAFGLNAPIWRFLAAPNVPVEYPLPTDKPPEVGHLESPFHQGLREEPGGSSGERS